MAQATYSFCHAGRHVKNRHAHQHGRAGSLLALRPWTAQQLDACKYCAEKIEGRNERAGRPTCADICSSSLGCV